VEDSRGRVSPPSTRLSVRFIAPPEPPAAPEVDAGDGEVRVRWRPPARLPDGTAAGPLSYEVSRASTADGPADAVFPVPAGTTEYLDKGLENDRPYYYAVRAIRDDAGTIARGEPSPRVAATPGRTTVPAPPTNLVAAPSGNAVRLSWAPSPDPGVAAYVVYRAAARGDFARIGSVRAPATTFTDRDLPRGSYRYVVTGQDATARANESPRSNEVSVTLP
jgi:large repetitive protein